MGELSHTDGRGQVRMVDVGAKGITSRRAIALGRIRVSPEVIEAVLGSKVPKGDVFAVARIAGIQAAKRTADWIPLCHPLPLDSAVVEIVAMGVNGPLDLPVAARWPEGLTVPPSEGGVGTGSGRGPGFLVWAEVAMAGRTGVEMEALCAVQGALLTLYDMLKGLDRGMEIGGVRLWLKEGGRSGRWVWDG